MTYDRYMFIEPRWVKRPGGQPQRVTSVNMYSIGWELSPRHFSSDVVSSFVDGDASFVFAAVER